ncbi:endolytic transglycosylase MltG [Streptomyces ipomoeae]|uniref:Endolytic murein transglycosylase n=1 Tax=Streptomyces ipomoeae TaxID=103232 RepID=A0AAE8W5K8_9ACTN|nr:endolytic transglycosylase MltG [Streptomyces ipomoeae]MDX2692069.1 endolytic transglycosylase MltG [Streptomyces ipomoeae]MDX2820089.1 endolytic transglycosylase MltG [Streptomyces ipomoeae]MDX2837652.1 endolytic transglycosylase MltG [Streptomyces ipomoeae]MDX2874591.1 endolytic transglycosylase MltG [Streptomyces ipomoeae]TQE38006.1 endolytic transglycosylase MltG [Streptomyces ipomoeae]
MQMNTPPRSTIRLTRRGRAALIAAGAVVAATAVAVPLLIVTSGDGGSERPTSLVIPEGWRATQVYEAVDKALDLPAGSTKKSLAKARLALPMDAEGNPEGYLFPATYPLTEKTTPESLLVSMVETANRKFGGGQITAGAQRNAMNVYQAVTIASIIQAEAATKQDMGKVARVVFNRLERGMPLQMDSTLNYALNRSTLDTSVADTKIRSPYNSYQRMGLPPTPIANPGEEAMQAAVNPPPGDWLYFVTVKPGDTRFTANYEEHLRNVAEFNQRRKSPSSSPRTKSPAALAAPTSPSQASG